MAFHGELSIEKKAQQNKHPGVEESEQDDYILVSVLEKSPKPSEKTPVILERSPAPSAQMPAVLEIPPAASAQMPAVLEISPAASETLIQEAQLDRVINGAAITNSPKTDPAMHPDQFAQIENDNNAHENPPVISHASLRMLFGKSKSHPSLSISKSKNDVVDECKPHEKKNADNITCSCLTVFSFFFNDIKCRVMDYCFPQKMGSTQKP